MILGTRPLTTGHPLNGQDKNTNYPGYVYTYIDCDKGLVNHDKTLSVVCLYNRLGNIISLSHLVKEKFDIVHCKDGTAVVHVLLEVPLQELEHQSEGLIRVHDVM